MLLAAMRLAMPLRVEGIVSEKMMAGAHRFMEIVHGWRREYRPVPIEADEVRPLRLGSGQASRAEGRQAASFFSGGVDSFYTALTRGRADVPPHQRLSALIFIHGFDIRLGDEQAHKTALAGLSAAAAELGQDLLCASTNLRQVTRRICDWPYYHGQVMAGVALGLSGMLRRVYIPSTYTARTPLPHGTHPLLDPLWSTETLDFVHDGSEVTRTEKVISRISRSPAALAHLRVCANYRSGLYNCGRCPQCVRTKVPLAIAGVLEKCGTLDATLTYDDVARYVYTDPGDRLFGQEDLEAAVARGADPRLVRALRRSLSPTARLAPRYWPFYARSASRAIQLRLLGGILDRATWQRWLRT
jgi:hypothetical protein